jgi:hypothetical protein
LASSQVSSPPFAPPLEADVKSPNALSGNFPYVVDSA